MGACFSVYNFTRREELRVSRLGADKARELCWHRSVPALITWYLLRRRGDDIVILSDYDFDKGHTPSLRPISRDDVRGFRDITEEEIGAAVAARVLIDHGSRRIFEDDPELTLREIEVDRRQGPLPGDDWLWRA